MKRAIREAEKSKAPFRVGSVIVDKSNNILSKGHSSNTKTHPKQSHYCYLSGQGNKKPYLHAEIHAISKLPRNSKPHKIYIARIGRRGDRLKINPCPICISAILDHNIKKIEVT